MSVFNGKSIQLEIYGESHSKEIGVKAKGFPKIKIDQEKLSDFLQRRKAKNGDERLLESRSGICA